MSNIITDIQLSGVTYTLSAETGGGGITSGEVQTMIDQSISGKVNTSDNIVSGASIQYAFDKEDTKSKFLYSNGERITEFYVKFIRNYNLTGANTWSNLFITTDGSSSSGTSMTVDASNYAITNIVSTSVDFTTTLENGVVKVVLPEGYYINYLQQNATFQISYDKYDISSGQTADVINEDLIDTIQDIYNEVPKRYVTSISTGLMSKQMNIYAAENAGSSQSSFLLGDSLKGDNSKLDVYFGGETISYTPETLNTGIGTYTKVPASPINKYGNGFGEIDLAVNTGFTGSSQSVPVIVNIIDNYSYTYNFSFTYDIVNKTINGGQSISNSYSNIYLGGNKIYIYPKINYKFRVVNIECSRGFICGVDTPVKDSFVFTGVTGNGYVKQGQDVIDELFRVKTSYNEMYNAINQATSGKVNTTAITSAVTSASTDSQIPSAKAVYDALGSAGGGITSGEVETMISAATSGITERIGEDEEVTARALNELAEADEVTARALIDLHDSLSGKAETSAVTAVQDSLSGYVATSAVTTAVTSGSTSVITSGGVYNQMGGMKIVKLTQSAYDSLSPNYDANTIYFIVN